MWPSKTWFFCRRWTTEFGIVIERPFCADIFASREHIQYDHFQDTSIGEGEQNVTLIQISTDSRLCEFWGETRHRAICYISIIFNGTIDSTSFKGKAHHSSEVKQVASFSKPWRRSPQVLSLPGCPIHYKPISPQSNHHTRSQPWLRRSRSLVLPLLLYWIWAVAGLLRSWRARSSPSCKRFTRWSS